MDRRNPNSGLYVNFDSGLGNQLFQYNFLYFLRDRLGQDVQLVRRSSPSRNDRPFDLEKFVLLFDPDVTIKVLSDKSLVEKVLGRIHPHGPKRSSNGFVYSVIREKTQFNFNADYATAKTENSIFMGYFQHSAYVEESFKFYGEKLCRYLNDLSDLAMRRTGITAQNGILHVRRGDLLKPECEGMGMLSVDYYSEALDKLGLNPSDSIILTDDYDNSVKIAQELGIPRILGPESLSAWESLSVFANTTKLISANSTLSWWGAFIGRQNGNIGVYPDVWFRNWNPDPGDSLHIRGLVKQQSKFESWT